MMSRFLNLIILCALAPLGLLAQQPTPLPPDYYNRGLSTNRVVHAKYFQNDGYFEVQTFVLSTNLSGAVFDPSLTPYDTSGSLNDLGTGTLGYLNNGTFRGLSVRFDAVKQFGERDSSSYFINTGSGVLDLADGFHYSFSDASGGVLLQARAFGQWFSPFSSATIDATNIWNQGLMRVGAGGVLKLGITNEFDGNIKSEMVNLNGGLIVTDPVGFAYGETIPTTFNGQFVTAGAATNSYLNELGIYDSYWGIGINTNQNARLMQTFGNTTFVSTPAFDYQTEFVGFNFRSAFTLINPQSFTYISIDPQQPTNIYIQTVFIQTPSADITADAKFYDIAYYPSQTQPGNGYLSAVIKLSSVTTNALTFQPEESSVYIMDQLGPSTNTVIINNDKYEFFRRPSSYFTSRNEPFEYLFGEDPNAIATPGLFYNPSYSNVVVTNFYSAYRFSFDSQVSYPPNVSGVNVHDLPGRIEINARNVDLEGAGIKGEGLVSINTDQLISTVGTIIDAPQLAFNLSYTNPGNRAAPLRVENLAKEAVARFRGTIRMWTGTFTNQVTDFFGQGDPSVYNLQFMTTVIDATGVSPIQQVNVAEFAARTEALQLVDNMIVSNRFQISSRNLNLAGNLELRNVNWTLTNMPNVTNIVIEPTANLRVNGLADFGSDAIGIPIDTAQYAPIYFHPPTSTYSFRTNDFPDNSFVTRSVVARTLTNFTHRGTITSYSQRINADNVDISGGDIFSGRTQLVLTVSPGGFLVYEPVFVRDAGPIYITANRSAKLNGGQILTDGDVNFNGPVYKLDHYDIFSGAAINLNVTEALLDSGSTAANRLSSSNGLTLSATAPTGNLLGTEVNAFPSPSGTYRMRWSVAGPTGEAFTNLTKPPTTVTLASLSNNAAAVYGSSVGVGRLFLHSGTNTSFEFRGTTTNRALFVDLLEIDGTGITNWTSLTNQLRLIYQTNSLPGNPASSIDIYYGDIVAPNLAKNLPLGFASLAEYLNGMEFPPASTNVVAGKTNIVKRGGALRWVPGFVGPNTSEDTVFRTGFTTNGLGVVTPIFVTVPINRAVRQSRILDLDADGISNADDDVPFNQSEPPVAIQSLNFVQADGKAAVKFKAFIGTYTLQYSDSLANSNWKTAATYKHTSSTAAVVTVVDPTPSGTGPRFYRLVYSRGL
jgi:hypothetical protein